MTHVLDLHYYAAESPPVRLGKVSLIGTRPALPQHSHWRETLRLPPLIPGEILRRFDMDVCRVGMEVGGQGFVFADEEKLRLSVQTRQALQRCMDGEPAERTASRREKYEARGFVVRRERESG